MFLIFRWNIVNEADTDAIVCWAVNGAAFVVNDVEAFSKEILPKFFKHSK